MIDFFQSSAANILGTLVGGSFLTFLLFLFDEKFFPKKNITGQWTVTIKINQTTHEPFKDLQIEYTFHFLQKNYEIEGLGEKIKDIRPNEKPYEFIRSKRVRQEISGYMERRFIGKTNVYLLVKEHGRIRISTTSYSLRFDKKNANRMYGSFEQTAGDARGTVELKKPS
jgi:hypothetical protein